MAYNNGFPINYQQMYPQYNYVPQQPIIQTQPVTNDNGIIWVQGEAGAKSWAVAPGKSVMLMDSENSVFYIKTTDNSGIPLPLRIFDYTERTQSTQPVNVIQHEQIDTSQFITKEELEKRLSEFVQRSEVE